MRFLDDSSATVDLEIPLLQGALAAAGRMSYQDETGTPHDVAVDLTIQPSGDRCWDCGHWVVPSFLANIALDPDKQAQSERRNIARVIEAGKPEQLLLAITSTKTAFYRLRVALRTASGRTIDSGPIYLHAFYGRTSTYVKDRQPEIVKTSWEMDSSELLAKSARFRAEAVYEEAQDSGASTNFAKAAQLFSKVLALMPAGSKSNDQSKALLYFKRGYSYSRSGQYRSAIRDLTEGLRLDGNRSVEVLTYRGDAYVALGNYRAATDDYRIGMSMDRSRNALSHNAFAWLVATRDVPGRKALGGEVLSAAQYAVKLNPTVNYLDTLACAYALVGDFNMAIKTETQATEHSKDPQFVDKLTMFQEHKDCLGVK